ncbi:MAG: tRNA (adenosine(37)-N6)-threonylcarbamoyltransferase complex dimerization subunit type 1 TsaB, partial [Deltaproteobacteria bacterium]|nr:tRNA (adenosine(37)-N6)-threonylcarbamoyltransferase complex dimerization subunit type 1 TsaB [Deltaproteobacteria bacterium]
MVLAWDTATPQTTAALVEIGPELAFRILSARLGDGSESHSAFLPPQVAEILQEAGRRPQEIDLVAVGRGPGSFTGLRTGLALAAGLGLAAGKPVAGLSTLTTLAAQASP